MVDELVMEGLGEPVIDVLIVELILGLLEVVWVCDFVGVTVFVTVAVWLSVAEAEAETDADGEFVFVAVFDADELDEPVIVVVGEFVIEGLIVTLMDGLLVVV